MWEKLRQSLLVLLVLLNAGIHAHGTHHKDGVEHETSSTATGKKCQSVTECHSSCQRITNDDGCIECNCTLPSHCDVTPVQCDVGCGLVFDDRGCPACDCTQEVSKRPKMFESLFNMLHPAATTSTTSSPRPDGFTTDFTTTPVFVPSSPLPVDSTLVPTTVPSTNQPATLVVLPGGLLVTSTPSFPQSTTLLPAALLDDFSTTGVPVLLSTPVSPSGRFIWDQQTSTFVPLDTTFSPIATTTFGPEMTSTGLPAGGRFLWDPTTTFVPEMTTTFGPEVTTFSQQMTSTDANGRWLWDPETTSTLSPEITTFDRTTFGPDITSPGIASGRLLFSTTEFEPVEATTFDPTFVPESSTIVPGGGSDTTSGPTTAGSTSGPSSTSRRHIVQKHRRFHRKRTTTTTRHPTTTDHSSSSTVSTPKSG